MFFFQVKNIQHRCVCDVIDVTIFLFLLLGCYVSVISVSSLYTTKHHQIINKNTCTHTHTHRQIKRKKIHLFRQVILANHISQQQQQKKVTVICYDKFSFSF